MKRLPLILLSLLVVAGAAVFAFTRAPLSGEEHAAACPPGYVSAGQREAIERREQRMMEARGYKERESEHEGEGDGCQLRKHPEPVAEIGAVNAARAVRQ